MPKTITCPHAGCKYLFSKPVHLRRHLLSHSDQAVWRCPDCSQEFKRIDSFQRHKKRIHPDQPTLSAVKIAAGDAKLQSHSSSNSNSNSNSNSEDNDDQDDDDDDQDADDDESNQIDLDGDASMASADARIAKHGRVRKSSPSTGTLPPLHSSSSSSATTPALPNHNNVLSPPNPSYDPISASPASAGTNNTNNTTTTTTTSAAYLGSNSTRPTSAASSHHTLPRSSHGYHPYARPDHAAHHSSSSTTSSAPAWHGPSPSQHSAYGASPSSTTSASHASNSGSMPPSMYSNMFAGSVPTAATGYAAAPSTTSFADAPLSIASLTDPSPSWGSTGASTASDEGQNFFDDILQSILMDSISSFVPHDTMAPIDVSVMGGDMTADPFMQQQQQQSQGAIPSHMAFGQPPLSTAQSHHHHHQQQQQQQQSQQTHLQQQSQLPNSQTQTNSQQLHSQAQGASHQMGALPSQVLPNPMPFATFTDSAHNSGRSTPGTPRLPPGASSDDADEMARSVEKVGDQAATNIGARTRDLVLHGVNIPKKPPRLTAASLFSSASRQIRSMLPILPSYWLLDHRRLAAERPLVFMSLLQLGTLWQPRADVKAYGQELWQLIFRSIWAGAVFYLDQPQQMREATAVMALTNLYAFMCRDEAIRRKAVHSSYTGSSLASEYAWRNGVWFLVGPWEESLQRLLGPTIQMALIELEVLERDSKAKNLSPQQKGLLEQLNGIWRQWSDAEECNRLMIGHGLTESHHSEFLANYGQSWSMGRMMSQALVACADDVWDAPTAIEWARLVLEYKSTREQKGQPLISGKKQMGFVLDELLSDETHKKERGGRGGGGGDGGGRAEMQRMLHFTLKEHFALVGLLEGLHLLWISRHTPPFRKAGSYALDFAPAVSAAEAVQSKMFCRRKALQSEPFYVTESMMLSGLSSWMRMFQESCHPSANAGVGVSASRMPTLGPSNDRFHLHFRWHVVQLSVLFNAHHVMQALWAPADANANASPGAGSTNVDLQCESCLDTSSCPYYDSRRQRWAALHAGAVIGSFMSMPRLSTLTPMILEGLGHSYGVLVLLCKLRRKSARRLACQCPAHVRECPVELVSDQCLHLDADRPSPHQTPAANRARFDSNHLCWLHHGLIDDGALLLGQSVQEWPIVLQDMGNELKSVAGTWQLADEFLRMSQRTLNSFTFTTV
ncbi:hypothetical protein BCV70DRAFT_203008 [Testicularia cyperi]|uniref:C2H2-type domain-containing protein n=1 Tax=Testicularia cyperi TaxID=1882483 RepID=A0A317XHY5_9BASI|nr:hypothetical protein BCV70DRAFT_203168 [Testicularia cyperi]PWY97292.1 hypothetical protein BCV70DRAFT_203008 [Testicularia cyperi]